MEVAMVDAVLKSSMGRMRRRSRMCMKQERERLEMWLENERRGSKVTPRLRTGASEMKVVEEELLDNRMEESGIFLIWAGNAKFLIRRVVCETFTIPGGNLDETQESLFTGQLPTRIVIGCVDNEAFNGSYKKNPYNFKHMNLSQLKIYLDG